MILPNNLTRDALVDYRRALRRARQEFGGAQSLKTRDRLVSHFRRIADGSAVGHQHAFAKPGASRLLCITVAPLLIFYDAETRNVLRVVDGRRDLSRLFAEPS